MTRGIFISYRRQESLVEARALFERLRAEFGRSGVFIDLEGLDYGKDFVEALDQNLNQCQVMLALIGPGWTESSLDSRRRLDNESDFVRVELRTALARAIRVVPVLLNGAMMPLAVELPDDLKALARRHAFSLDFRRFDADIARLIDALRPDLANATRTTSEDVSSPTPVQIATHSASTEAMQTHHGPAGSVRGSAQLSRSRGKEGKPPLPYDPIDRRNHYRAIAITAATAALVALAFVLALALK